MIDRAYDGVMLKCTNQAVLSDNELDKYGYSVPLEVMPSGQFEPLYKTTLSVQVFFMFMLQPTCYSNKNDASSAGARSLSSYSSFPSLQDGELPVLPLSVYGAVAMAHSVDSDEYSSPSQFFFYLYDKRNVSSEGNCAYLLNIIIR